MIMVLAISFVNLLGLEAVLRGLDEWLRTIEAQTLATSVSLPPPIAGAGQTDVASASCSL